VTEPSPVVLLIEDEPQVRRFLRTSLPAHGYKLVEAETGSDGLVQAAQHRPDVVLLDLGLPDLDGIEVVKRLREWSTAPIVVVSARGREQDKIDALDAGADDYLTKPFGVGELLARIRVALRHAAGAQRTPDATFASGPLRVDLARRQVFVADAEVHLTPIEYRLLGQLIKHAGMVLTHRQMLREVWGPHAERQTHYLRVHMANLRHKIEPNPSRPTLVITEPGVGYRLKVD
jgi:two-component system KDP operon response regulator KdpE